MDIEQDLAKLERPQFGSKRRPLPPKHAVVELINIEEELNIIKSTNLQGTVDLLTTPVEAERFPASFLELVNCDRNLNGSTAWSSWILENELMPVLRAAHPLFYDQMKNFVIS